MKKPRPETVIGYTYKMHTECGNLYVTVTKQDEKPFEVFTSMGKAGGCASAQCEAISRLVSIALRSEIEPAEIINQLKGIKCHNANEKVSSCADAIAKALEKEVKTDV
jgi:ribonucleoside-diphosphate reductase alpha chain